MDDDVINHRANCIPSRYVRKHGVPETRSENSFITRESHDVCIAFKKGQILVTKLSVNNIIVVNDIFAKTLNSDLLRF